MKRYLIFLVAMVSLASCKKAQQGYPYQYNPVTDYLPMAVGNTWEYGISGGDTPNTYYDSVKVTMTADQSMIDGKTFSIALTTSTDIYGIPNFYFYKDNATYKTYSTILIDHYTGDNFDVPFMMNGKVFNRDTTYYILGNGSANAPEWKIQVSTDEVPQNVTIGSTTYKNCIGSYVAMEKLYDGTDAQYIGQYQQSDTYQFLFAPNVGMIEEIWGWNDMILTLLHSDVKL
jgi:hypothetical protein